MFGDSSFKLHKDDNNDDENPQHPHKHRVPTKEEAESAGMIGSLLIAHAMQYGPCSAMAIMSATIEILRHIARGMGNPNA